MYGGFIASKAAMLSLLTLNTKAAARGSRVVVTLVVSLKVALFNFVLVCDALSLGGSVLAGAEFAETGAGAIFSVLGDVRVVDGSFQSGDDTTRVLLVYWMTLENQNNSMRKVLTRFGHGCEDVYVCDVFRGGYVG